MRDEVEVSLCVKCMRNPADVAEPCCGAPDCVDTVYLVCAECEQEQYEQDMMEAQEWADRYEDES